MNTRHPFAFAVSSALVLLVYKGLTIARLAPAPIALGWLLEVATLMLLWSLCELARPVRWLGTGARVLFYALAHALLVTILAHTYFFESAAERRFSLLEVDLRTLRFFFTHVLPVRGVLSMAAWMALVHALAFAATRRTRIGVPALPAGAAALALCALLVNVSELPSPLADLAGDAAERLFTPKMVIDRSKPARFSPRLLDRSALPAHGDARYDKVLVFVMETMTSEFMDKETPALPASTFVRSAPAHAHHYDNYYATNQDSRTGMLSMLGSRFIPHEAYTEEDRDHYMFLGERSSLVDAMKARGYRSAFAVSQQEVELVVSDLPWDEVLNLQEGEAEQLSGKYLCFIPYEFEHSCEDRALLPRVLDFLDRTPRAFLYQEFIWGHAAEYNQASGRTNTDYYSAYLDAIVEHLKRNGALERTLIVLTSDHGFRDKGVQRERAVYRLPLWFYTPSFREEHRGALHSHLDFKDLLFEHAFEGAPTPSASPFVMVIGPTGTSFLTVLTEAGQMLLLKARLDSRHLVHAEGFSDRAQAAQQGSAFLRLYDDYRDYFRHL